MTHDSARGRTARPFPWRCPQCGKKTVQAAVIDYSVEVKYEGRLYSLHLPEFVVPRCQACQELVFDNRASDQIYTALRRQVKVLTPDEIGRRRTSLGLAQSDLAAQLGVAEDTLARWEDGLLIQPRAMDNLLRLYLDVPEAREALSKHWDALRTAGVPAAESDDGTGSHTHEVSEVSLTA